MIRSWPTGLAQRSGLEAGDTIVNVSGYQIGYVNGRLIDLTDELARRIRYAGPSDCPGAQQSQPYTGQRAAAVFHDRTSRRSGHRPSNAQFSQAISPSAILLVRLLDVTRPEWSDVTVAEQTIPNIKQFPIGYRLDLPPQNIRPDHRYALDAQVQ